MQLFVTVYVINENMKTSFCISLLYPTTLLNSLILVAFCEFHRIFLHRRLYVFKWWCINVFILLLHYSLEVYIQFFIFKNNFILGNFKHVENRIVVVNPVYLTSSLNSYPHIVCNVLFFNAFGFDSHSNAGLIKWLGSVPSFNGIYISLLNIW